jgi:hypothetical protein
MIKTKPIQIGELEFNVAPLNFTTLIYEVPKLQEALMKLTPEQKPGKEQFETVVNFIYKAIKRTDADVTLEQIMDNLDVSNMSDVVGQIMSNSGAITRGEAAADSQ